MIHFIRIVFDINFFKKDKKIILFYFWIALHWRSLHSTSGVFCLSFIAFMHAASATFRVQVKSFFLLFCNLENWWSHTPYKIWTYCQKKKACEKNSQKERYGWGKGVRHNIYQTILEKKKNLCSPPEKFPLLCLVEEA